jgi:hypothetical protein
MPYYRKHIVLVAQYATERQSFTKFRAGSNRPPGPEFWRYFRMAPPPRGRDERHIICGQSLVGDSQRNETPIFRFSLDDRCGRANHARIRNCKRAGPPLGVEFKQHGYNDEISNSRPWLLVFSGSAR